MAPGWNRTGLLIDVSASENVGVGENDGLVAVDPVKLDQPPDGALQVPSPRR